MKRYITHIGLAVGILLAGGFLAFHLHQGTEEKVLAQFYEHQLLIARQTARQIESYFHARSQDVRHLSSFPSFRHLDAKAIQADIQENFDRLKTLHIKEVFVLDAKGKVVYSTGGDAIGSNYTRSDIYAWAKDPGNKGMVRLVKEKSDRQGTPETGEGVKPSPLRPSLVTPLYQESVAGGSPGPGGEFAGILLLTVDLGKMLTDQTLMYTPTNRLNTLCIWVMDDDGTLLLESEHPEMVLKNIREKDETCNRCHGSFDYAEKILTEKQGTVEYQLKGKQRKVAAFAPMTFEDVSWIVVVNAPKKEVTDFIRKNVIEVVGLLGIVMLATGLASFSMYRSHKQKMVVEKEIKDLQEKKGLVEELRETRDYLENLIGYANAPIIVWDPKFRITRFNRAFERMTGRRAEEVIGFQLDILFPDDSREEAMAHIRRTMTGERWETVDIPILRIDGSLRIVLWNSANLHAADGKTVIATIAQGQDITERKQADRDILRRNRELSVLHAIGGAVAHSLDLQEILNTALEATLASLRIEAGCFFLLEPDGETMTICAHRGLSDEFVRNVRKIRLGEGVSGRAAAEKKPIVLDVAEYPSERLAPHIVREGLRTIASTPLISAGEVVGALNLGTRRPHVFPPEELQLLSSIGLQLGQAVRNAQLYESVKKEIAERKKTEEVLRDAHQRLAVHDRQMPLGHITYDQDFRVAGWNPAAERIFGWSAGEVEGKHPFELFVLPEAQAHVSGVFAELIESDDPRYSLDTNLRKDGKTIVCEWFITPLRDASGNVSTMCAMAHDVTEKTQMEKQLRTAQRMESVGTLAGGIAHDFNNALTGILGYGELLRMRLADNPNALADLDEISRAAERAATLTRQLLTFARRQVVELANMDLRDVVKDTVKFFAKVAGEHIEVKTFLAADTPIVRADRGQIEQVLMNLVINAKDAMTGGGQLLVETGGVILEEEYIQKNKYMKKGRYALLVVSDTGIGMDEATRERVFEPFFTTKTPDKGTGLGLSVAYGIVKQHNGFIHLYSEPGKGSTFKVYFPAVEAPPDVKIPVMTEPIRGGNETILLAEDEESIRTLAERILKEIGYTVITACNGEEAVELFRRHREKIALALLDVVMPRMGGKVAYEAMRKDNPGLKMIFMSGYSANAIHESFVLRPDTPFLGKPFAPTVLARKVREVLDR